MAGGIEWFRWHHGSVTDPKFMLVARKAGVSLPDVLAVWAFVLEKASAADQRGFVGELDADAIDCLFGFDDGATASILEHMRARSLIDGQTVASWDKRQPKRERPDDNSTDRVRAHRAKEGHVTPADTSKAQETPVDAKESTETPRNATERQETPRGEERRGEKKEEGEGETRKRAAAPIRPDDVDEQVWQDWLQLRKTKKATVSPTVIAEARIEAGKAGLTLERFLSVWCARGSQGLMADWLKPNERDSGPAHQPARPQTESFAERDARNKREKWEQETGRKWPVNELPASARPTTPLTILVDENSIRRIS